MAISLAFGQKRNGSVREIQESCREIAALSL
jgi:hypothetical protein